MRVAKRPLPTVIHVRIDRAEPLAGVAATEDGDTLPFEGWMELIRAVSELLSSPDRPPIEEGWAASLRQRLSLENRERPPRRSGVNGAAPRRAAG